MTSLDIAEQLDIATPSPEQAIYPTWPNAEKYHLFVKRDDLLHDKISGNKWRKLKYALTHYSEHHVKSLVSFGGGYSNHLHALSYACNKLDIQLTAMVRGYYAQQLTPMLNDVLAWGTKVEYVDKITYSKRNDATYLEQLRSEYPNAQVVPEGGSQTRALRGVREIIEELQQAYDYILTPVGSGGTMAGLISANCPTKVIGIAALKGPGYLEELVSSLVPESCNNNNWEIHHDAHFGGYAKRDNTLTSFCHDFQKENGFHIEPVYSGKLFYATRNLIQQNWFEPNSRILLIHTGGLQGSRP